MKKTLISCFLVVLAPAYACGLPAAPDESSILSLVDPVDVMIVLLLASAVVAAVGPAIRKRLSRLGR